MVTPRVAAGRPKLCWLRLGRGYWVPLVVLLAFLFASALPSFSRRSTVLPVSMSKQGFICPILECNSRRGDYSGLRTHLNTEHVGVAPTSEWLQLSGSKMSRMRNWSGGSAYEFLQALSCHWETQGPQAGAPPGVTS